MEYVRSAVQRGVALSPLLRGVRIGHDFVLQDWEDRLTAMGLAPEAFMDAMRASLRYTFGFVDALGEGIANEYQRERERWFRGAKAVRAEAIHAIVEGSPVDVDTASRELGSELRRHHLGLVRWGEPAAGETASLQQLERAATEIARGLGGAAPALVCCGKRPPVGVGGDARGLGSRSGGGQRPRVLARARERRGRRARRRHRGVPQDALRRRRRLACRDGVRAPPRNRHALPLGRSLAALLGGDTARARRFVRSELGPLAEDDDEAARLRITLKVYLEESGSRVGTARRLNVHPNTVANRVQTCRDMLDRSLGDRRVQLEVALALAELLGPAVRRADEARRGAPV